MFYNSLSCLAALLTGNITSSRTLFYYIPVWENKLNAFVGIFMYAMWGILAIVLAKDFMARSYLMPITSGFLLFVSVKLIVRKVYR